MLLFQIVVVVIGFVASVLGLGILPRYWRGDLVAVHEAGTASWWPLGEALKRGFLRTLHLGIVGSIFLFGSAAGLLLKRVVTNSDSVEKASLVAFLLFGVTTLIDIIIVLFNVPKALVPPPYRDEPGALTLWWKSARRRRKAWFRVGSG